MPVNTLEQPWTEVFLVGGGSSLKGFDFTRLRERVVVAVNDALLYLPWATAVFSIDAQWVENRLHQLRTFAGSKYLAISPVNGLEANYLQKVRGLELSEQWPVVHAAGNSGYGALNLAVLKGAKRIVLLGYDFYSAKQHWHAGYRWVSTSAEDGVYAHWAEHFTSALPQLNRLGVEVLNASPKSLITAFPKVSIDEVL